MQFTWVAIYQILNGNWQNYEQGVMPQPQLSRKISDLGLEEEGRRGGSQLVVCSQMI